MKHACVFVLLLLIAARCAAAQTDSRLLPQLGFDERLDGPPTLAPALAQAGVRAGDLPLFVRLVVQDSDLVTATGTFDFVALDERMEVYANLKVPVLLALAGVPASTTDVDAWRQLVAALAERYRRGVLGYQIGLTDDGRAAAAPVREYAYYLKLASVQIRAVHPQAFLVQAAAPGDPRVWQAELYQEDVAPYVDGVAVNGSEALAPGLADLEKRFSEIRALAGERDAGATMMLTGVELDEADRGQQWLVAYVSFTGEKQTVFTFSGPSAAAASVLRAANGLKDMFAADVVPLDERSVSLTLTADGRDVTSAVPHRLLYKLSTLATYFVTWGLDDATGDLQLDLTDQIGRAPVVRDIATGRVTQVRTFAWDPVTKRSRSIVPASDGPVVVAFSYEGDVFVERVDVVKAVGLTVAEIIARHQQAQAAQDALYQNYVARALMEQHFRPSPTDTVDVVSDTRYFFDDRQGVEWEELSFSVNGAKWGADRPSFPLLQAEKVLSLPLDLRFTTDYRYSLEGRERVGDRECYVVEFEPIDSIRSLYRGRVWIDTERFVRLKVRAVQTRLTGPMVSNEETQLFEPVAQIQNDTLYLFSRVSSKQIFLIAGRNLLVEKEVRFSDFRLDAPDFIELRAAARESNRIMYRDTDQGVRYFVKRGSERVVSDQSTTSAKALAMGATIDPSYDFALPIVGINYLDFDFLGRDSQLAVLFGGVLVLANLQKPKLGRTPFEASVDIFAMAVPVNDQVFDEVGERRGERVRSVPFSTGLNVGYQFREFHKLSAGYAFRYDAYMRDDEAAASFTPPTQTATNGVTLSYEFKRAGYSLGASAGTFRRSAWRPWGLEGSTFDPGETDYRRYMMSLSKAFYLGAFQKIYLNAAWFGGEQLDRFSMYQFGLFDETRMHGVPSAGIRFAELAMFRSSYSFNVFEQYRFDVFVDQAVGRDPRSRSEWLPVTGTGIAINVRAPWRTMLRADVGKSFLPQVYRGAGSVVVQVMLLKPL